MSETKTESSGTRRTTSLGQLLGDFWRKTSGDSIICLNCGTSNPLGETSCENCEKTLQRPASTVVNVFDTLFRPLRGMARIAATAPVRQAFVVVIGMIAVYLLVGVISTLLTLNQVEPEVTNFNRDYPAAQDQLAPEDRFVKFTYYLRSTAAVRADKVKFEQDFKTELDKVKPEDRIRAYNSFLNNPPVPGVTFIVAQLVFLLLSWSFFSISLFYTARLFYRNDTRANMFQLLAVVGFARLSGLSGFLFLIPLPSEAGYGLQIAALVWQLGLVVVGVRFSTGLSWNRAAIIVAIPFLIFRFFLNIPI